MESVGDIFPESSRTGWVQTDSDLALTWVIIPRSRNNDGSGAKHNPSEQALAASCGVSSVRHRKSSSSVPFRAVGKIRANKVAELPGFKDSYRLGEGSDGDSDGHHDDVALSQQEAKKASRKKPYRPRDNKKWSVGAELQLVPIGEHLPFPCTHSTRGRRRAVDSGHGA